MGTRATYSIFCDWGGDDAIVGCGNWVGKEDTKADARNLARRYGWSKIGADSWLCPRHEREAAPARGEST